MEMRMLGMSAIYLPLQNHPLYNTGRCSAFVHDLTDEERIPLSSHSVDYITVLFVLSSLDQSKLAKM